MFLSYRNNSIDFQRKSVHWFLQDGKIKTNPVNPCNQPVFIKGNDQNREVFRILSSIEAYRQASKIVNGFQPLNIVQNSPILDV